MKAKFFALVLAAGLSGSAFATPSGAHGNNDLNALPQQGSQAVTVAESKPAPSGSHGNNEHAGLFQHSVLVAEQDADHNRAT